LQRIAFLLDDSVGALVLVTRLLEQLLEFFGIVDDVRCGLAHAARRTLRDQPGEGARITDDTQHLGQMPGIAA